MTAAITRLHICPFSPDLLPVIIPPSISSAARNISYHHIQTFPENKYGFVDLPAMEADKIKKKLNGSILKGKKMKIEEARAQKRQRNDDETEKIAELTLATVESTAPRTKKAKKDPAVIEGHEISTERRVKRGWTESKPEKSKRSKKDKTDRPSSKYSDKDELLFRTRVPPNKVGKNVKPGKKDRKRGDSRIVHEFEKSTSQPSFLRSQGADDSEQVALYVDGKGWMNADGQVVEQEHGRTLRQRRLERKAVEAASKSKQKEEDPVEQSSSSDSGTDSEKEAEHTPRPNNSKTLEVGPAESFDQTSSSGASDSEASTDEMETSSAQLNSSPHITVTSTETPPEEEQSQSGLHPLEALFKKPINPASQDIAKPSLEVQTTFSFFDPDNKDDIEDEPMIPLTPFSSQDLRARDHRSAAPTPDTAYPSRFNSYGSTVSEKLGAEEEGDLEQRTRSRGTRTASALQQAEREPSDFEKKFWEKRGDNNRAWKQRRRETLKEKRQKENRAKKGRGW